MKKFKLYIDKDKEEIWINTMAKEGYNLKKFFLGFYTFERSEEKYFYRIDLLKNWEGNKDEFVSFMEESGVEYVSQWYRWVFLRKKISDGEFILYSDRESLIEHYSRIMRFFFIAFFIEVLCGLLQLPAILLDGSILNGICLVILWFFAVVLLSGSIRTARKINGLKSI